MNTLGDISFVTSYTPAPEPPRIAPVKEISAGDGADLGASAEKKQPDLPALAEAKALTDPDPLTGPPPAFQASLLDVERDLQHALAQMAAQREYGSTPADPEAALWGEHAQSATPYEDT